VKAIKTLTWKTGNQTLLNDRHGRIALSSVSQNYERYYCDS